MALGQINSRTYGDIPSPLTPKRGLITFLDMLQAYARIFVEGVERLQSVRYGIMTLQHTEQEKPTEELIKNLQDALAYMEAASGTVDMPATLHLINALSIEAPKHRLSFDELDAKIDDIQLMARNELRNRQFFHVPPTEARYYSNVKVFGAKVADTFPQAVTDIEEAGNCYALGRATACVFHLMRVVPYGMDRLAKQLRVKYSLPIECLEWGSIIQPIEKAVRNMQNLARSKKKLASIKHYSEIVAHLYFCKDAWRNHVSHGRDAYDLAQARSVMDHVGLVMKLLAERK